MKKIWRLRRINTQMRYRNNFHSLKITLSNSPQSIQYIYSLYYCPLFAVRCSARFFRAVFMRSNILSRYWCCHLKHIVQTRTQNIACFQQSIEQLFKTTERGEKKSEIEIYDAWLIHSLFQITVCKSPFGNNDEINRNAVEIDASHFVIENSPLNFGPKSNQSVATVKVIFRKQGR